MTGFESVKTIVNAVSHKVLLNCILKINFMNNLLYIIAVILIIGWLLGFFAFHAGNIIHSLLVIALVVIIIRVIQGRKVV